MKFIIGFVICLAISGLTFGYPTSDEEEEKDPEQGDYFEGDLDLSLEQMMALEGNSKNILKKEKYRWPNKTVHYKFANGQFNEALKNHILLGLQTIEQVSCIRFIPADNKTTAFINITSEPTGCHATVGYHGKEQNVNLALNKVDKGCFRLATIIHEFLHALGFYHQQSASNRDDYVKIEVDNIIPGKEHNFKKFSSKVVEDFGIAYDYGSVMHYGPRSFTNNGKKTIIPIPNAKVEIGQRRGMSLKDIHKLNIMYKCPMQP